MARRRTKRKQEKVEGEAVVNRVENLDENLDVENPDEEKDKEEVVVVVQEKDYFQEVVKFK